MMTSADMEKQTMKASKPAMEKRRRARINESLQQLKALVLDGLNKNNSRHSKLEKADILEMTVRYLRNVQRHQVKASVETDPAVITQYRTGFAECMGEVSRYLGGAIDENPEVRARLLGHLAGLCTTTQQHYPHQPVKYAVVSHGQMPSPRTGHVQPSPCATPVATSASSSGGRVARNSAPTPVITTTPSSAQHQPQMMQVSFPTPPLSSGCHVTPATLMTSTTVEGARNGRVSQVLSSQAPQLPLMKGASDSPPSPKPGKPMRTQPVMVTQSIHTRTQQAPQPTGDMITLILPSQSLPGGQVPTHLIPVYAQDPGKGVSSPLGFSFANPEVVAAFSTATGSSACSDKNFKVRTVSTPSPKAASTALTYTVANDQPAAWTAIPLPTAQLISPQAGAVAPSAMTPPFAFSIPFNAKISPPGLAIQAKQPTERADRFIRPAGLFPANNEPSGVNDPMWRPW